ncbi:MAG: hypothetical protein AAGC85_19710, partial [Bacteroidota bacterium]
MNKPVGLSYGAFGFLILVVSFLAFIPTTRLFLESPSQLSVGILLDLLITVPIGYFFLIRKKKIPNFTIIYVFILGLLLASWIIPAAHQQLLVRVKTIAIPLIEVGVISMLIYKMSSLRTFLKNVKGTDFYDRLLLACQDVFPGRIGRILATEMAVMYYLFSWRKKHTSQENGYTYFQRSGIKSIISALIFLLMVETIVVHILVDHWNPRLAWVLSLLGSYAILQVLAILRSMNQRLILIDHQSKELKLRYGFGSQVYIPFNAIEKIEKYHSQVKESEGHVSLSLFDIVDTHNLTI